MNRKNIEPSDEELRERLHSFLEVEIASEDVADEDTIRREVLRFGAVHALFPGSHAADSGEPTFMARPTPRRAQHCVLLAVDVAGFTDVRRDDEIQLAIREALYVLLSEAFDGARLPWQECLHEDRGDGVLIIVPAKMPSATVIDPLLERIHAGLRRHNRMASDAATIRLRVAVHVGEVHSDRYGLAGTAINHLFRILDAPVLKQAMADSGAEVALIVSDYFYESVIRYAPGMIDPTTFRPAMVRVKETRTGAWIHLPAIASKMPSLLSPDRLYPRSLGPRFRSSGETLSGAHLEPEVLPFRWEPDEGAAYAET